MYRMSITLGRVEYLLGKYYTHYTACIVRPKCASQCISNFHYFSFYGECFVERPEENGNGV